MSFYAGQCTYTYIQESARISQVTGHQLVEDTTGITGITRLQPHLKCMARIEGVYQKGSEATHQATAGGWHQGILGHCYKRQVHNVHMHATYAKSFLELLN